MAPDSTPSVCYYLYTQSGKLNKIRLILHKKENQTLLADCFEPLCCLASSQFDFSEEQCTQLKETLTALSSQTIASKSQIINDYHINYKKTKITALSNSQIESCLEITLYK